MTTPTEPLDLDAVEARANAATPGPWWGGGDRQSRNAYGLVGRTTDRGTGNAIAVLSGTDMDRVADAEFIAAAREDVPALIAEVRRLREAPTPYDVLHWLDTEARLDAEELDMAAEHFGVEIEWRTG